MDCMVAVSDRLPCFREPYLTHTLLERKRIPPWRGRNRLRSLIEVGVRKRRRRVSLIGLNSGNAMEEDVHLGRSFSASSGIFAASSSYINFKIELESRQSLGETAVAECLCFSCLFTSDDLGVSRLLYD